MKGGERSWGGWSRDAFTETVVRLGRGKEVERDVTDLGPEKHDLMNRRASEEALAGRGHADPLPLACLGSIESMDISRMGKKFDTYFERFLLFPK